MRRRHPVTPSRPVEGHWRLPMTMAAFRFVTTSRAAGREEHPQGALNSVGPWPPKRLTDGRVQRPRERHCRRTLTGQRGNEPAAAVPMRATPARQACSQFPRDGHGPEHPLCFPVSRLPPRQVSARRSCPTAAHTACFARPVPGTLASDRGNKRNFAASGMKLLRTM